MNPQSIEEWDSYIEVLSDEDLWSQSVSANTESFAQELLHEGFSVMFVKRVVQLFAKQLASRNLKIPDGGAYDMHTLARLL